MVVSDLIDQVELWYCYIEDKISGIGGIAVKGYNNDNNIDPRWRLMLIFAALGIVFIIASILVK